MNTKVWYLLYFEGVYHTHLIERYSKLNAHMIHNMFRIFYMCSMYLMYIIYIITLDTYSMHIVCKAPNCILCIFEEGINISWAFIKYQYYFLLKEKGATWKDTFQAAQLGRYMVFFWNFARDKMINTNLWS